MSLIQSPGRSEAAIDDGRLVPLGLPISLSRARWTSWDRAVGYVLLVAAVLVVMTFADYGITHDEQVQADYGEKLLSWYLTGFADRSAFEFLDLFWYGGLFDLVAAVLNRLSPFGYYETRHLLGGLVGVLGLVAAWRLGRLSGGPRVGLIAAVMLAMTPAFVGHSFNNPKDAPFAVGMLWALYALAKVVIELPRPRWATVLWFGAAVGLALSIRVGALLILCYLGVAVLTHFALRLRIIGWKPAARQGMALALRLTVALGLCGAIVAVFWPWAMEAPLNALAALTHFSHYDIYIDSLFNGQLVEATNLPALYLPGYLLVTLPEVVLLGLAVSAAGLLVRRRHHWRHDARATAVVTLAALFPIAFVMITRPTAYEGIRHFLFIEPPLVVLSALGIDRLWHWAEARSRLWGRLAGGLLLGAVAMQAMVIARLHPDEYVYYNSLVGGVHGAAGKWEMDYWSNSMHEAVDRLAAAVLLENEGTPPSVPVKVRVCGDPFTASYFFPPFLTLAQTMGEADYALALSKWDCWRTWRGRPVAEIERFGAVLSVVKDRRGLVNPDEE